MEAVDVASAGPERRRPPVERAEAALATAERRIARMTEADAELGVGMSVMAASDEYDVRAAVTAGAVSRVALAALPEPVQIGRAHV